MIGRLIVQALALWTGWFFAHWLKDMRLRSERLQLRQVRARHDDRYDAPLRARRKWPVISAFVLFGIQIWCAGATVASPSHRMRTWLTVLSLGLALPSVVTLISVHTEYQRSDLRDRHDRTPRIRRMNAKATVRADAAPSTATAA